MFESWSIDVILAFFAVHHAWAAVIFGLLAFGESLVIIGVIIPGTAVMIASGALVGAGVLPFWEIFVGGSIGAILGDSVSFWVGRKLGPGAEQMWPFKTRPHLLIAGERIFASWGWIAVFVGRFIGPLRATVPVAAGIMAMPQSTFQIVNIGSALVWIPFIVTPGAMFSWMVELVEAGRLWEAVAVGGALAVLILAVALAIRRYAPRILAKREAGPQ